MFKIGCHISSTSGFLVMGRTAASLGANVFQFFTRNPRGGTAKDWKDSDIAIYTEFAAANGITSPLAHAPYTLNAAASRPDIREFTRRMMAEDLKKLEKIPAAMYNFHPGSHVRQGVKRGIELVVECLNAAVSPDGTVPVLLETMAGKGSEIGGKFEELRAIIDGADESIRHRLGVTLDTCHVYDAGYDIVKNLRGVLEEFDRVIGLDRLKAIHLNDSKYPIASHHDRHERLEKGSLGIKTISAVINHRALLHLPFYLETPNENEGYAREIELLKSLRKFS